MIEILGQKLKNLRLIPSEDLFFGLHPRISDNFLPIRKVLENHDSGKCHKIWEKFYRPPKFFWAATPMSCEHCIRQV